MSEPKILKRSEVPEKYTWNLKDMFESDEAWLAEYEALKSVPEEAAKFQGKLGNSAEELLSYFKLSDELLVRLRKLHCYANCIADEDMANAKYQDFRSKATSIMVEISAADAFADTEILAIPEETMEKFYKDCPELETYRRSIYKIRRRAAHILSEGEEALLASAGEMAKSPDEIGSILRNVDLKFPEVIDKNGNAHKLTSGSFVPLLENSDRDLRRDAFETYYKRMNEFKNTAAMTIDGEFKQRNFFAKARKYNSTLEAALDRTEVPVEVYENLIDAVHGNLDKMYRYVALRKKLLGVDELHMYDIYTPIIEGAPNEISFEEAKETVLEALGVLGKDYTDVVKEGFDNRWIDVYENEGKKSGAYSTGGGRPHPYVLLNHKDNLSSMFTLAHEMGHSLHSYYSCKNQPINTSQYVIFVAEVASTCNEVLLTRYLLSKTTDKHARACVINHFLDSFKGTTFRQTMFAEFEMEIGRMAEKGISLSADVLSKKYHELNKLYFGPDMISDEGIALEWMRIPHFFYNYYVFQYATGFSAAVAIANRILAEGEPAVRDYKKFLSSGGSTDPISLLKIAGVDMSTPDPINSALKLFGELVDELEEIS